MTTNMVTMDAVRLAVVLACLAVFPEVTQGQLYLQPTSPQAFFTNQEFVVTCYATPGSDASDMVWKSPTGVITDTEGRIHVEGDEQGEEAQQSLRLVVQGVRQTDAGDYVCSAKVDGEQVKSTFKMIVYRSITFPGTPEEHVSVEGSDTTVLCHAVADPDPIISWRFNGSAINNDGHFHKTKEGLQIRNVTRADEGTYTCRAILVTSKNSQVKGIDIRLRVQYAPEWHEPHMLEAYSSIGSSASLSCKAHGFPDPNYQWLKDGDVLDNGDLHNVTHHEGGSTLHVMVTNVSQFGDYLCRASNDLDFKERNIELLEGETPQVPSVGVSHSEPGKLILSLAPEEESNSAAHQGLKVLGFRVQFRPSSAPWHMAKSRDFQLADDEYILKGLDRSVDYVVRVAARNAAGLGPYSQELRHRTQPLPPATILGAQNTSQAPNSPFQSSALLLHASWIFVSPLLALMRF